MHLQDVQVGEARQGGAVDALVQVAARHQLHHQARAAGHLQARAVHLRACSHM
jgi:hypothetical protein